MTAETPPRRFRWRRFFFGLIAPVAAPLAALIALGGFADPWVFIIVWGILIVVGLTAGLKHRHWEFLLGLLAAVAVLLVLLLLTRLGWLSW